MSPTPPPARPLDVVVVNGGPRTEGSRTLALAELVTTALAARAAVEVSRVDVYGLGPGFTGAVGREDVPPDVEARLARVEGADLLVVAVPVYRAAYPGMFKHLFDLVHQHALVGTPVVLTATGGSARHALVVEHQLRPLFAFFRALVAPVALYASPADLGDAGADPELLLRVEDALDDVVEVLRARAGRRPAWALTGEGARSAS